MLGRANGRRLPQAPSAIVALRRLLFAVAFFARGVLPVSFFVRAAGLALLLYGVAACMALLLCTWGGYMCVWGCPYACAVCICARRS